VTGGIPPTLGKANLYLHISSDNTTPEVGETFLLTYKLGNNGTKAAKNVTIPYRYQEGLK
jgi:trimeric autotransporter adhesin